jgi:hypothetical protein
LGDAADGRSPDDGPVRHLVQARVRQPFLDDEGVGRVLAFEDGAEFAAGRELGRDVLERVNDRVDLARQECDFELLGPESCDNRRVSVTLDCRRCGSMGEREETNLFLQKCRAVESGHCLREWSAATERE